VEGRKILDGIILIHESIHSLRTSKIPGMMLKLDLSNAYEKLNWIFLANILTSFDFHRQWVEWVLKLVSSAFFSIFVNGSPPGPSRRPGGLDRVTLFPHFSLL